MTKKLTICLLFVSFIGFSQVNPKKLIGMWVTCEKIDALAKLETITFVKDDVPAESACIAKSCVYSRWTFEKKVDDVAKMVFYRLAGCKDAASVSENTFNGTWNLEKDKKTLTIFDDHFTKFTFTVESLTDTELKLVKVK